MRLVQIICVSIFQDAKILVSYICDTKVNNKKKKSLKCLLKHQISCWLRVFSLSLSLFWKGGDSFRCKLYELCKIQPWVVIRYLVSSLFVCLFIILFIALIFISPKTASRFPSQKCLFDSVLTCKFISHKPIYLLLLFKKIYRL